MDWNKIGESAIDAGISGAIGTGLGLLGGIGAGKRQRRAIEAQKNAQKELNEQAASLNYEYGEKAAENARISAEAAITRSLLLLELLRELARVERKNGFENLAGKVNEWLSSGWSEKCVLAGNPALWQQGQLLLVVGALQRFHGRESWKR